MFDRVAGNNDRIEIRALREYLQDRVACNERELYELFERLDWSRIGAISLEDFVRELTPLGERPEIPNRTNGTLTPEI